MTRLNCSNLPISFFIFTFFIQSDMLELRFEAIIYIRGYKMHYIELETDMPFVYNLTGKFVAPSPNWMLTTDYSLMDYVLIIVTDEILYFTYAQHNYTVPPKSYLLLPPLPAPYNILRGFRPSACSFYWFRFTAKSFRIKNVLPDKADDYFFSLPADVISLPVQSELPDYAHSIIDVKQLQDAVCNHYDTRILNYLITIILYDIFRQLSPFTPPGSCKTVDKISKKQIYNNILNYVKTNIDKPIRVEDIAYYFGYNKKYISFLFKEHAGITLKQYILNTKIELANFFLSNTDKPVSSIAKELGFFFILNFSAVYKRVMGITPTEYRNARSVRM